MGAYIGLAKFFPEKRLIYTFIGVGLAVFFHGAYDFFLMQQVYEGMAVIAMFVLIWGINMARRLVRVGQELSPFKSRGEAVEPIVDAPIDSEKLDKDFI